MKKVCLFAILAVTGTSAANAGWLDYLGLGKKSEPATLEEACDTSEIQQVCPEIVLGTKTVQECLAENVSNLSKKCANFVKKSITDKKDAALEQVNAVKDAATAQTAEAKEQVVAEKQAAKEQKAAAKQALAEQKAAAKAAGKEMVDAAKETGTAAKETGKAFKEIF